MFLNWKLRILAGGGGIFAGFLVIVTGGIQVVAQEDEKELLADAKSATVSASVVTGIASAKSNRMSMKEILDTPLEGKLSLSVINRIEELPSEKEQVEAGEFEGAPLASEELEASDILKRQSEHWKPMLVLLTAHHDDIPAPEAEAKVESLLQASEQLGNAAIVQEGIDLDDPKLAAMEARLHASEALLAEAVRKVMISRRSETWWMEWRDAWNRGVTRVPERLVGQWAVRENSGVNFAQALIGDRRCTVIWQERAGGKVQKIDFEVARAEDDILAADESDSGLRYRIGGEDQHEPVLIFDVPGRRADSILKLELTPDW